jgi:crossover junction endodeoxyribonuclease RusA
MHTTIEVSLPPSVNQIWRSARGRVFRSKPYVAWLRQAGWQLAVQRPRLVAGPVDIVIAAGKPDRRRRDVDDLPKAILDLLTLHRVLEDDSQVMKLTASWDNSVPPGVVRVTVECAMAMA